MREHGLEAKAVEIVRMAMTTDYQSPFDEKSAMKLVGYDMTRKAAEKVCERAGMGPERIGRTRDHSCVR